MARKTKEKRYTKAAKKVKKAVVVWAKKVCLLFPRVKAAVVTFLIG